MIPANAELWDLLIQINVEKGTINVDEVPKISGVVTDHAGKVIPDAQIRVRSGQISLLTTSDAEGKFQAQLGGENRIPGTYIINIMASTDDGRMGVANSEFVVRGALNPSSATENLLSNPTASRYLQATPEEFANDPLGLTLYNYYQKLFEKYITEKGIDEKIAQDRIKMEKTRIIASQNLQKVLDEKKPSAGTITDWQYGKMTSHLDPDVKDVIKEQLSHTTTNFDEAQKTKEWILKNGGTMEEAMKAYYEMLSLSREQMENIGFKSDQFLNYNVTNSTAISIAESTNSTVENVDETLKLNLNGTDVSIKSDGISIFLELNGNLIQFQVNGTKITQITNSTN